MKEKKCVLCGKIFTGWSNNPYPLADEGECCDDCNRDVITARIIGLNKETSKQETNESIIKEYLEPDDEEIFYNAFISAGYSQKETLDLINIINTSLGPDDNWKDESKNIKFIREDTTRTLKRYKRRDRK